MSNYNTETHEVIKSRILTNINSDLAKMEGSTLSNIASGIAIDIAQLYAALSTTEDLVFIKDTFDEFLDTRINEFGLYRKLGEHATGEVYIEGVEGTAIDNGTKIEYGGLIYTVIQDITLKSDVEQNVTQIQADDIGLKYNLNANTEFNLIEPNSNVTRISNRVPFKGGTERETDDEFRERFTIYMTDKATSGNVADYMQWATSVDGVKDARAYPLWNGNGTVKIVIFGNSNTAVDESVLNNCKEYINIKKPIGADVTVVTPTALNINIAATLTLESGAILENVKSEFLMLVNEYFKDAGKKIAYIKVLGLLANISEVVDIKNLTLNGATNDISVGDEQIAVANLDGVVSDA